MSISLSTSNRIPKKAELSPANSGIASSPQLSQPLVVSGSREKLDDSARRDLGTHQVARDASVELVSVGYESADAHERIAFRHRVAEGS